MLLILVAISIIALGTAHAMRRRPYRRGKQLHEPRLLRLMEKIEKKKLRNEVLLYGMSYHDARVLKEMESLGACEVNIKEYVQANAAREQKAIADLAQVEFNDSLECITGLAREGEYRPMGPAFDQELNSLLDLDCLKASKNDFSDGTLFDCPKCGGYHS